MAFAGSRCSYGMTVGKFSLGWEAAPGRLKSWQPWEDKICK